MILRNLWRRKIRTALTIFGIAVGVAAVLALSAFGEGMATGMAALSASTAADLQVAQKEALMLMLSAVDDEMEAELRQLRGVEEVAGTVIGFVQMTDAPYFAALGEDPRGFTIQRYQLIEGRAVVTRREIMLGELAARNFEKGVGDTFRLQGRSFQVVGIYSTGVSLEDGGAVMHLEDAQRSFDRRNQVSYYNLKLRDPGEADAIKTIIEERWPELVAVRSGEATREDEMLNMYRSLGWFLGIFAVIVGGLGMTIAMLMSVFERTREIGVLRAVGWRRGRILRMIAGEALALALIGGLLGVGLGLGLTTLASLSPAVASMLQGVFTIDMFVQALVIALLLGVIGGVYPAWRAARLAPIDAMRAESGAPVHWGRGMALVARMSGGALRNLWRRPLRTLITMTGIGVGVGFIVALLAMAAGVEKSFTDLLGPGQTDLIAEEANVSDASLSVIDERIADRIKTMPEVRSVSKLVFGFTSAPGLPYLLLYGLDPREEYMAHYHVREGRTVLRSDEIMLGRLAAEGLEKGVGDTLNIGGSRYDVVGIYENGAPFEDTGAVIYFRDAQTMFRKRRQVSFLAISLHDPALAGPVATALEQAYPEVMFSKTSELTERMQDFATMDAIFNALAMLTVVVGGVVMTNVMLMSVFERTHEIGMLRALGWRRGRILRMVLVEALALSFLSGLAGIAIGVGLGQLFLLAPEYGSFLVPLYTPEMIATVLGLTLLLGAFGGLYPAWRATRLSPVEALRYE